MQNTMVEGEGGIVAAGEKNKREKGKEKGRKIALKPGKVLKNTSFRVINSKKIRYVPPVTNFFIGNGNGNGNQLGLYAYMKKMNLK